MKKITKIKIATGVKIGAATAAAAGVAAGIYLLSGKHGAKNRKKLKGWATKARNEVAYEMKRLKKFDRKAYEKILQGVAMRYKSLRGVSSQEIKKVLGELRGDWKNIQKHVSQIAQNKK